MKFFGEVQCATDYILVVIHYVVVMVTAAFAGVCTLLRASCSMYYSTSEWVSH